MSKREPKTRPESKADHGPASRGARLSSQLMNETECNEFTQVAQLRGVVRLAEADDRRYHDARVGKLADVFFPLMHVRTRICMMATACEAMKNSTGSRRPTSGMKGRDWVRGTLSPTEAG
jgi:hypothetical protein